MTTGREVLEQVREALRRHVSDPPLRARPAREALLAALDGCIVLTEAEVAEGATDAREALRHLEPGGIWLTAEEAERIEALIARLNAGPLTTQAWQAEQLACRSLLWPNPVSSDEAASYVALLTPDEAEPDEAILESWRGSDEVETR